MLTLIMVTMPQLNYSSIALSLTMVGDSWLKGNAIFSCHIGVEFFPNICSECLHPTVHCSLKLHDQLFKHRQGPTHTLVDMFVNPNLSCADGTIF